MSLIVYSCAHINDAFGRAWRFVVSASTNVIIFQPYRRWHDRRQVILVFFSVSVHLFVRKYLLFRFWREKTPCLSDFIIFNEVRSQSNQTIIMVQHRHHHQQASHHLCMYYNMPFLHTWQQQKTPASPRRTRITTSCVARASSRCRRDTRCKHSS